MNSLFNVCMGIFIVVVFFFWGGGGGVHWPLEMYQIIYYIINLINCECDLAP